MGRKNGLPTITIDIGLSEPVANPYKYSTEPPRARCPHISQEQEDALTDDEWAALTAKYHVEAFGEVWATMCKSCQAKIRPSAISVGCDTK